MNFDRVAPHYRWLEALVFGNRLQEARLAFVSEIRPPWRVLVAGEGNGRFLAEFVRAHPAAEVDCVEASARMIALARGRDPGRARFIHARLEELALERGAYDLIVTHFFLDCFQESILRGVIKGLARAAAKDATWLVSEFSIPEKGIERVQARCWLWTMYCFFRATAGIEASELIDYTPFLRAERFVLMRQHLFGEGLLKSELWKREMEA